MKRSLPRYFVCICLLLSGLQARTPVCAQKNNNPVYDIGPIDSSGHRAYQIAIPYFLKTPDSLALQASALSDVINGDLKRTGFFEPLKNQQFVEEQNRLDLRKQQVDFGEWRRLRSDFLVRATYTLSAEQIGAQVELWECGKGVRVFGRNYANFTPAQWRVMAHKIADDIQFYITSKHGVGNTKIVFVHGEQALRGRVKEIFTMDADGANPKRLTNDRSLLATPCWGKNATEIFYTTYRDFNPDLCRISAEGGESTFISRFPGFNLSPSWDPVSERIALTLGKDGNSEIYTMDRNGKGIKRLTWTKAIDSSPSWFPNGRQMLFTSDRTGGPQIYMMGADGVNPQRLTFQGNYNDSAVLSPKGDVLALTGRVNETFNIYLVGINGRDWKQLTGTRGRQGNNEDPSWAPNGEQLAFTSDRSGAQQIYVMNIDGSNVTQLTSTGFNHSPAWSPFLEPAQ